MKKWLTVVKVALCVALAGVVTGVFLQRRHTAYNVSRNCYEVAQSATGLIICPDGSSGSGVVVKRGERLFLWTAAHVVSDCDTVAVRDYVRHAGKRIGHTEFAARVISRNEPLDVALLWLIAPDGFFDAVEFADPMPCRVGQPVYHVGNFYGANFDDSVSTGVISQIGVRPNIPSWPWVTQLDQTTAFVVYGSSGGGIFRSADNQLIGILVGGNWPGVSDINVFVPVREIFRWAQRDNLTWAMYGDLAPSEETLELAWLAAASKRVAALLPPSP